MIEFWDIAKEHGISVAIMSLLIPGAWWVSRLDKQVKENTEALASVHNECHVPAGAVRSLEDKVHALEVQDASVLSRLDSLEEGQGRMEGKIDRILEHFAKKGMDS